MSIHQLHPAEIRLMALRSRLNEMLMYTPKQDGDEYLREAIYRALNDDEKQSWKDVRERDGK